VGTIRVEPEPPLKESVCESCGGTNSLVHGYVYEDERDRPDLLGAVVPRAAELKGSGIDHFWHVTDHVVLDDPRLVAVRGWLERQ